jgi:hypothetical protein
MNLAQVIHQRWAAAAALDELLPAARVYTGLSVDPTPPYAVISRPDQSPVSLLHDGSGVDAVMLRIQVYHDQYDAAAAIVEQVKAAFDRTSFELAGGDRVLSMRRTGDSEHQGEDGLWCLLVDFRSAVYLASGI